MNVDLKKYCFILLVTIITIVYGCEETLIITENNPQDSKIGVDYFNIYYDLTHEQNYDSLFSFFHFLSKDTLIKKTRSQIETIHGEFYGVETERVYSKRVVKGNAVKIYFEILSICEFERGETEEILAFEIRDDKAYFIRNEINVLAN